MNYSNYPKRSVAICVLLVVFMQRVSAQGDLFKNATGKIYSREQVDSLGDLGYFVEIENGRIVGKNTVYNFFFYTKLNYKIEGRYCGNPNHLTIAEIKMHFPYNQAATIMVASFLIPDSIAKFPSGSLKLNAPLDKNQLKEIITLDAKQQNDMLNVLANFRIGPDYKSARGEAECYEPNHAVLFLDKNQRLIGYEEICFECHRTIPYPANLFVGESCFEKLAILEELFRKAGIHFDPKLKAQASFPGGSFERDKFIKEHLKITHGNCAGKVFIRFKVYKDGTLGEYNVMVGLSAECDQIAMDIVKSMPRWIPATAYPDEIIESSMAVAIPFKK